MFTPTFFGTVSLVVGIIGYLPYVWGIWKRTVKPHPLSWLTWGVITSIAAAAQWSGGAGGAALWVMVSTIVFHFLFAFVGFVIDKSRVVVRSDWYFFFAALAAIPLWVVTDEPLVAVVLVIVIDLLVLWPTLRKTIVDPQSESALMWGLGIIKWGAALLAPEVYVPVTLVYPALWVVCNTLITGYLVYRGMVK